MTRNNVTGPFSAQIGTIASLQCAWRQGRATLYRGPNYRDDALEISEDVANLQLVREHDCHEGGLNDCVSSVRVRPR